MGSRMIALKAIMANGVEGNDNFSIRTVFEDDCFKSGISIRILNLMT
jgi:hypothetical protein